MRKVFNPETGELETFYDDEPFEPVSIEPSKPIAAIVERLKAITSKPVNKDKKPLTNYERKKRWRENHPDQNREKQREYMRNYRKNKGQ